MQKKKGRAKLQKYGEAITAEEGLNRLKKKEEGKKRKKPTTQRKSKRRKRQIQRDEDSEVNENVCPCCEGNFYDDTPEIQEAWIGCDNLECGRWFHSVCVNFDSAHSTANYWICPKCKG